MKEIKFDLKKYKREQISNQEVHEIYDEVEEKYVSMFEKNFSWIFGAFLSIFFYVNRSDPCL